MDIVTGITNNCKNMSHSLSHLCYLQTLPPISHNATFNGCQIPPLPPRNFNSSERRRKLYVTCGRGNNRASTPKKDDYHATLKALNSKGRTPRKSLGQVRNLWWPIVLLHCKKKIFLIVLWIFFLGTLWGISSNMRWGCVVFYLEFLGLTYLSLLSRLSTCETVWENS
jgi:hypothetical protein